MKIYLKVLAPLLALLLGPLTLFSQQPGIFMLRSLDSDSAKTGFISLSDVYPLSEHPDSSAIPGAGEEEGLSAEQVSLTGKYRHMCLAKTGISESEKVYLYNYQTNRSLVLRVKDLPLIATMNIYGANKPYTQFDYMIGFEINSASIKLLGQSTGMVLAAISKKDPFIKKPMQNLKWAEVVGGTFPEMAAPVGNTRAFKEGEYHVGKMRVAKTDSLTFYCRELLKDDYLFAKQLLVIHSRSKKVIFQNLFYSSESASFASEDAQWTGYLFNGRPPVLMQFQCSSFGCPEIIFLKQGTESIYLKCDNRH